MVAAVLLVACGAPARTPAPVPLPAASASVAPPRIDPWTSASLARSNATGAVPAGGLRLIVSKSAVSLADGTKLVPVPADASQGVDATYKRRGPNDLYIVPLAQSVQAQSAHDVLVAFDPSVPYRLFVEVLFTLGQSDVTKIDLLVRTDAGPATIEATLPHFDPAQLRTPSLGLTALIVKDGISLKARGGNIAPGCKDVGAGLAIPNKDGARDWAALVQCADHLKHVSADFESETNVTIAANPVTDFQTIVTTMDALRPMFPRVMFGLSM